MSFRRCFWILQLFFSHSFLVFLTGQDEIESACKMLRRNLPSMHNVRLVPFYAQRRTADVNDVFRIDKVCLISI